MSKENQEQEVVESEIVEVDKTIDIYVVAYRYNTLTPDWSIHVPMPQDINDKNKAWEQGGTFGVDRRLIKITLPR